ncbi:hypothetical protein EB796_021886 [Bugula neritina]|uniref:Uncharacterized protein n=1 Tax=Bugula neritina TaxID=10212 RepID=A0A7J7J230_BUGNE|nr:hypothetical protein EB796_021886 [Bugula neritina]
MFAKSYSNILLLSKICSLRTVLINMQKLSNLSIKAKCYSARSLIVSYCKVPRPVTYTVCKLTDCKHMSCGIYSQSRIYLEGTRLLAKKY